MTGKIDIVGSVSRESVGSGCGPCGGGGFFGKPFDLCVQPSAVQDVERTINSPSTWIDLLAASGISVAKLVHLAASGGTLQIRYSTGLAADQQLPLSDLLILVARTAGAEITALAVRGTGQLYGTIAGA